MELFFQVTTPSPRTNTKNLQNVKLSNPDDFSLEEWLLFPYEKGGTPWLLECPPALTPFLRNRENDISLNSDYFHPRIQAIANLLIAIQDAYQDSPIIQNILRNLPPAPNLTTGNQETDLHIREILSKDLNPTPDLIQFLFQLSVFTGHDDRPVPFNAKTTRLATSSPGSSSFALPASPFDSFRGLTSTTGEEPTTSNPHLLNPEEINKLSKISRGSSSGTSPSIPQVNSSGLRTQDFQIPEVLDRVRKKNLFASQNDSTGGLPYDKLVGYGFQPLEIAFLHAIEPTIQELPDGNREKQALSFALRGTAREREQHDLANLGVVLFADNESTPDLSPLGKTYAEKIIQKLCYVLNPSQLDNPEGLLQRCRENQLLKGEISDFANRLLPPEPQSSTILDEATSIPSLLNPLVDGAE